MENEWRIVEIDGCQYREKITSDGVPSGGKVTVKLYRPILTDEEFELRKNAILAALQRYGKSAIDQGVKI